MKLIHFSEGLRIFNHSLKTKIYGYKKYPGSAEEICRQIIKDCWNGRFFQTSNGHFCQFWIRDFGWSTEGLLKLGYHKKVYLTLDYALNLFKKYNKTTASITPKGIPYDFPNYAVDSLPWLLNSLTLLNNKKLILKYKDFLDKEILRFYGLVYDKKLNLVDPEKRFSSIKDYSLRKSSCYDNVMMISLMGNIKKINRKFNLKLVNPFPDINHKKIFLKNFWNGSFFYDDLTKKSYLAGDASIFPFVMGIINSKEMLESVITEIQKNNLDKPFPLKYTSKKAKVKFIPAERLVSGYEKEALWLHLGLLYLKLLKGFDKKLFLKHFIQYQNLIEKYGNLIEVFNNEGKPFRTCFYLADSGMLWAVNYLELL